MVRAVLVASLLFPVEGSFAADYATDAAATAINALGIDLLAKAAKPEANALISPYSIQSAMAMTCAGADGVTLKEMKQVLHYPESEAELHASFEALRKALIAVEQSSVTDARRSNQFGQTNDPVSLMVADRLFGQKGFQFRPEFLALTREVYGAPFEELDFKRNPLQATQPLRTAPISTEWRRGRWMVTSTFKTYSIELYSSSTKMERRPLRPQPYLHGTAEVEKEQNPLRYESIARSCSPSSIAPAELACFSAALRLARGQLRAYLSSMAPLTNAQIREFKARAQRMKTTVKVGKDGLSPQFLAGLDEALRHNELLKVKFDEFKDQKKELAPQLAEKTGSQLVTRVGNVVVLFRPKPVEKCS